jgi:hypothetical protein
MKRDDDRLPALTMQAGSCRDSRLRLPRRRVLQHDGLSVEEREADCAVAQPLHLDESGCDLTGIKADVAEDTLVKLRKLPFCGSPQSVNHHGRNNALAFRKGSSEKANIVPSRRMRQKGMAACWFAHDHLVLCIE